MPLTTRVLWLRRELALIVASGRETPGVSRATPAMLRASGTRSAISSTFTASPVSVRVKSRVWRTPVTTNSLTVPWVRVKTNDDPPEETEIFWFSMAL